MRIKCSVTFLEGTRRFEAGDVVTVPDDDGARFIRNGWAEIEGAPSAAVQPDNVPSVNLNVQSATLGQRAASVEG